MIDALGHVVTFTLENRGELKSGVVVENDGSGEVQGYHG